MERCPVCGGVTTCPTPGAWPPGYFPRTEKGWYPEPGGSISDDPETRAPGE
jgi:hypothetical protein